MLTRFVTWARSLFYLPIPKPEPKPDPYLGIQVFGGDGEAQENPFAHWPKGWTHRSSRGRGVSGCIRCDRVHLRTDAGIWIVIPGGDTRSGHDPEEGPVNVIKVMEFANEVYPIGTRDFPPNKYDRRWEELFPKSESIKKASEG